MKQPELLTPFAESHLSFRDEKTLDGSLTCAAIFAEPSQRPLFPGINEQGLHNSHGPRVRWMRQLERNGTSPLQLIDDDFNDAPLHRNSLIQSRKLAGMENQFG